ncbi:MAG TPA: branched-chain amino acid ABC transporter permease [Kofleriaceae bacterium]|nr:branched-chain amino acid ABC transporter permease [Kofleriaceae bacterium]
MSGFLEILVNTLALGSLYALIALGYTLVYGVLRFINFAHSDVVTWGAWIGLTVATSLGWAATSAPAFGLPAVMLVAMVACGVMGYAIEALAYRPLRRAPRLNVLITAIGVSLFLQNLGQLEHVHAKVHGVGFTFSLFGTQPGDLKGLVSDQALFHVGQLAVPTVDVVVVAIAVVLVLALQWLIFRTRLGQAMRAVSFDERVAALMGIDVNRVISITFVIGSMLAAAGGVLFAARRDNIPQTADTTWVLLGLKAFVAAVVGGIGNVRGAAVGALLIATIEQFGARYLSSSYKDVYVFAVLILVLLFRPSGILGKAVVEKV